MPRRAPFALMVLAGLAIGAAPGIVASRARAAERPLAIHAAPRVPVHERRRLTPPHRAIRLPLPPVPPTPVLAAAPIAKPPPSPAHVAPPPPQPATPPAPRFAALRSDKVYLRVGPGFRFPVLWVYRRIGMPVEIERDFGLWRLVRTPDGARGWMHSATLKGRRNGIVTGTDHRLRKAPDPTAPAVAIVEPGVILKLLRCDAGAAWCRVEARDYRGWLPRADFWGTLPGEKVEGQ
ncbi:MAG: hypothetical protein KGI51_00300 [Rhodospirillales bacterium]|nr:hypothetical protein [Rhodospirillales bacterium]